MWRSSADSVDAEEIEDLSAITQASRLKDAKEQCSLLSNVSTLPCVLCRQNKSTLQHPIKRGKNKSERGCIQVYEELWRSEAAEGGERGRAGVGNERRIPTVNYGRPLHP